VTTMSQTFSSTSTFLGVGLASWDVSKVADMTRTFNTATSLTSCNKHRIALAWKSSAVFVATSYGTDWASFTCPPQTDAQFKRASWDWVQNTASATQKWGTIGDWDVSGVKDFSRAFSTTRDVDGSRGSGGSAQNPKAKLFTFVELENWATTSVTTLYRTFSDANAMNADLAKWDVAKVTSLRDTFLGASRFTGSGVDSWNTKSVTTLKWTFYGASSMNAGLGKWDVSKVTDLDETFNKASAFQGDGLAHWNTTSVSTFAPSFTTTFELNSGITACNKRKIADVWSTESTSIDERTMERTIH
jgi:hypothetical protein